MQGVCDVIRLLPPHQIHPMRLQCYIINIKSACRAGFIKSGISHLTQSQVCAQSSQNPLEFLNVYFDGILNPKLFPGKTLLLQFWGVILSDIQISIQQKYGLWFKYINISTIRRHFHIFCTLDCLTFGTNKSFHSTLGLSPFMGYDYDSFRPSYRGYSGFVPGFSVYAV